MMVCEECPNDSTSGSLPDDKRPSRVSPCQRSVFGCPTPKLVSCLKNVECRRVSRGWHEQLREFKVSPLAERRTSIPARKAGHCLCQSLHGWFTGRRHHRLRMLVDHLMLVFVPSAVFSYRENVDWLPGPQRACPPEHIIPHGGLLLRTQTFSLSVSDLVKTAVGLLTPVSAERSVASFLCQRHIECTDIDQEACCGSITVRCSDDSAHNVWMRPGPPVVAVHAEHRPPTELDKVSGAGLDVCFLRLVVWLWCGHLRVQPEIRSIVEIYLSLRRGSCQA